MTAEYDRIADELRDDPLYVEEPGGEQRGLDAGAQETVRQALRDSSNDTYIAVLPASDYSVQAQREFAAELRRTLGDGTYLVIFGDRSEVSIGSTDLSDTGETAQDLLSKAFNDADGDPEQTLVGFVDQIDNAIAESTDGSSGGGSGGWLPLGILAAAGGGGFLLYRRNKRNKELAQLNEARTALDEDITAYGERLSTLDLDLQPTSAVPAEARDEYARALDLYEGAKDTSERAERPMDLRPVTQKLEEGRWLLTCVDARLNQQPVPERRPPCFFDPSHGPSTEDVLWAPPGGSSRMVPACAGDAHRIGQGEDPNSRLVTTADGRQTPYWDAGPAYAGWAGGYYGGFLPGIMWGTMLGFSMGAPLGGAAGDGGGDFGGGDFGGGDGGDFGGGDFGGFGGGDFGGGDFGGF